MARWTRSGKPGEGDRWRRMVRLGRILGLAALVGGLVGQAGPAQSQLPPPPVSVPTGRPVFTPSQLDQLLAPIALYPDPLLGQMLMGATYPLEVVQAARWLEDPAHAALRGDALAAALEPQPWDPSVKALVAFPQVLRMMNGSLDWTAALGDAFLSDGAAVMDAIQRLRLRAQSAGTLASTPQQAVSSTEQAIVVMPVTPQVVYVPVYDPRVVYGSWVYTHYPYFAFPAPVPLGSPPVVGIGFSVGIVIVEPYWGWHDWDWPGRRLHIDVGRFSRLGGHPPPGGVIWQHDPDHRRGVPYRDPGTRTRFPGSRPLPLPDTRGYGPGPVTPPPSPGSFGRLTVPPVPGRVIVAPPGPAGVPRSLPPAFESFGRGADVRTQTDRGKSSRQIILPPSRPAAPRPGTLRSAPAAPPKGAPSGGTRPGIGTFRR